MEKTIKQLKKEFMDAYRWALKVQKACMFKPFSVQVDCGYTEGNDSEGSIDAWTVSLCLFDGDKYFSITWHPYYDRDDAFFEKAEQLEKYLADKGITLK